MVMRMRRRLLFCLPVLFGMSASLASAQEAINVKKTDKSIVSAKLDDLNKVTFSKDEMMMTLHLTDGATSVVKLNELAAITFGEYTQTSISNAVVQQVKFFASDGMLRILSPDGISQVAVCDVAGKRFYAKKLDGKVVEHKIPLSAIRNGIYIVRVHTQTAVVGQKITVK